MGVGADLGVCVRLVVGGWWGLWLCELLFGCCYRVFVGSFGGCILVLLGFGLVVLLVVCLVVLVFDWYVE